MDKDEKNMKQNVKNNSPQDALRHNGPNKIISRLAAEKKKTVFAFCLIAVMVLMWVKVLGKKTPQAAGAATMTQQVNPDASESNPQLKISFVELPEVAGRNDIITRDFFDSDGWRQFGEGGRSAGIGEVSVSEGGSEEIARKVAEKLRLEAVGLSGNPRAFINDKLMSVGDKLLVGDGVDTYECELVSIEEDTVLIKCQEAQITLKLKQLK